MREPRSGKPNCTTTERVYYTNKTTENALISGLLYNIMGILLTKCPPSQMYIIKHTHTNSMYLLFEYVTYLSTCTVRDPYLYTMSQGSVC